MSLHESAFETPDGAVLTYRVRAGTRPLVLLHGLGCDASMWDGVVAALPRTAGILIPELRGHGGSSLGWRSPSVDLWAEDVLAIVRREGFERPLVAGLSMGGYTTLAVAASEPRLARAWGLVSTSAAPDDDAGRAKRAAGLATIRENGWRTFLGGLLPSLLARGRADGDENRVHLLRMFERAGDTGLAAALYALASRPDRRELLPLIAARAAVVVGSEDVLTAPEKAREIAGAIPRAALTVLPGVGHMSAMEAPGEVAAALSALDGAGG